MVLWPNVRAKSTVRWLTIVVYSFVFYGWWDWRFLFLLIGTGTIDFAAAILMERYPRRGRVLLIISIVTNIGSLVFFKYLDFAAETLRGLLNLPPQTWNWTHAIILPIGISFYTFQSLSYTIDVYRQRLPAVRNPLHFFAFLSMFPQLVAGPIVRAVDLLPQLETPGHYNRVNRMDGLRLVVWGFVKKLVIADGVAVVVNEIFSRGEVSNNAPLWWLAGGLFAIQIFADFSGYSDIARGIARWMGYQFPENFHQPYAAVGFRDFWSRWHISLSTWFRDYVYIPLGGSKNGAVATSVNQMATMLISGLWHGANWTFVIWGTFHGVLLVLERLFFGRIQSSGLNVVRVLGWGFTLSAVIVGWVIFRANNVHQAFFAVRAMFVGVWDLDPALQCVSLQCNLALGVCGIGTLWWGLVRYRIVPAMGRLPLAVQATVSILGICAAIFLRGPGSDFIYFQF